MINLPQKDNNNRDTKLKKTIEEFIRRDKNLSGYDINVRVLKGKTTIQGVVDTLADKTQAQKVVESIEGVGGVENNITVSTDGAVDDRHVYMEIQQELEGDPRLKDTGVKVQVHKGKVTLSGKVDSAHEKHAVQDAVSKAVGVKQVIDNINVGKSTEIDDADIVNEVRRIFAVEGIGGSRLKVSSKDGVVSLEGEAAVEERNRALEAAAKITGV
ncbi:MAG: hypothetical protein CVU88_02955, partial [Firmicutes bacterium HGW-Firmicutes-13]